MGGYRPVSKTCTRCETDFLGVWNKTLCVECELVGYDHVCQYCNVNYIDSQRYRTYCKTCTDNRVWQRGKRTAEVGLKISEAKLKFFKTEKGREVAVSVGKQNSEKMKQYHQTSAGIETRNRVSKQNSDLMKKKIESGEFTPKITNTFTHWDAIIDVDGIQKKFRSSWEACVWFSNQHWEYETIRIPYVDISGNRKIYIVDFYDPINRILIEIKPKSNIKDNLHKIDAAEQYCLENSMKFIILNETNIRNYINESIFIGQNKKQLDKCYARIRT
jgi:hypothetical protein